MTVLTLFLLACSGGSTTDTGSNTGDDDNGGDTGSSFSVPDLFDGLGAEDCEAFDGTPYVGATSYFGGSYDVSGDTITGKEYWLLFPNTQWAELGAEDCLMVWDITGTTEACTSGCTIQLTVSGSFDGDASNCPQALEDSDGEDFTVSYDVTDVGGTAEVAFTTSGNALGSGSYSATQITWVSDYGCDVF